MALILTLYGAVFLVFPQCGLHNCKGQKWRISCNRFSSCRYYTVPNSKCVSVMVNAIPHHYWIIDWFMSLVFILILQWPNLHQFWFFTCQTWANSDFTIARLVLNLIFYLPVWDQNWFFTWQTGSNSDFFLLKKCQKWLKKRPK